MSSSSPIIDLTGLQTESRNANSVNIDKVSTLELCQILNYEDASVAAAVEPCLGVISNAIDAVAPRVRRGGRLLYIGAGTSGRLGVLDASEIPPTYSAPPEQFVAIIAGGDVALRHAREGAEDNMEAAVADLTALNMDPELDSLIGLATSGRTPYVLSGLAYARSLGCVTIGITCVEPSAMAREGNADYLIAAVTGPEVVTGSTRMKAGTAQKMTLNMISTGVMIKTGKTYGNLMVDMKASNLKLKQRAKNLLRAIGGSKCPADDRELETLLAECNGKLKLAAATILLQGSAAEAQECLDRNGGVLAKVVGEIDARDAASSSVSSPRSNFVICVDGGGSKTTAALAGVNGESSMGQAGPSNLSNHGIDAALSNIAQSIKAAIDNCPSTKGCSLGALNLSKVWVAIAGYERPSIRSQVRPHLVKVLGVDLGERLHLSGDIDFLPVAAEIPSEVESAIVLVAGTGSISMSYKRERGIFVRTGRVGGWGHLLGDDGSGYDIGRQGLRVALAAADDLRLCEQMGKPAAHPDVLVQGIFEHVETTNPGFDKHELLSTILVPDLAKLQDKDAEAATAKRVADISKVVVAVSETSEVAHDIVERGAVSLGRLVQRLLAAGDMNLSTAGLVLAGGLMQDRVYQAKVLQFLASQGVQFASVTTVQNPAEAGARALVHQSQRSLN